MLSVIHPALLKLASHDGNAGAAASDIMCNIDFAYEAWSA